MIPSILQIGGFRASPVVSRPGTFMPASISTTPKLAATLATKAKLEAKMETKAKLDGNVGLDKS